MEGWVKRTVGRAENEGMGEEDEGRALSLAL